jgi:hypothetical protein
VSRATKVRTVHQRPALKECKVCKEYRVHKAHKVYVVRKVMLAPRDQQAHPVLPEKQDHKEQLDQPDLLVPKVQQVHQEVAVVERLEQQAPLGRLVQQALRDRRVQLD